MLCQFYCQKRQQTHIRISFANTYFHIILFYYFIFLLSYYFIFLFSCCLQQQSKTTRIFHTHPPSPPNLSKEEDMGVSRILLSKKGNDKNGAGAIFESKELRKHSSKEQTYILFEWIFLFFCSPLLWILRNTWRVFGCLLAKNRKRAPLGASEWAVSQAHSALQGESLSFRRYLFLFCLFSVSEVSPVFLFERDLKYIWKRFEKGLCIFTIPHQNWVC